MPCHPELHGPRRPLHESDRGACRHRAAGGDAVRREALKLGFEISAEAQSHVQLRQPVIEPLGEARSDTEIVFDLATRLGLGQHFWEGDIDAAYRAQLAPSGIALETLREHPEGVRVPLLTRYRKFAEERDAASPGSPRRPQVSLVGAIPGPRLRSPAGLRRADGRSDRAARPRRALPAGPHCAHNGPSARASIAPSRACQALARSGG